MAYQSDNDNVPGRRANLPQAAHFQDDGDCPASYFDQPQPYEDARVVERTVYSSVPYNRFCSTVFKTSRVRMPRVTFIDGPYRRAA